MKRLALSIPRPVFVVARIAAVLIALGVVMKPAPASADWYCGVNYTCQFSGFCEGYTAVEQHYCYDQWGNSMWWEELAGCCMWA